MIQAMVLENLLKKHGYEVVGKAQKGSDAIKLALELVPDLITMDVSLMDQIDGITAATKIQEIRSIPVIYITGNTDKYNFERAKKTYFFDILSKPVFSGKLISAIEKAAEIIANSEAPRTGS